MNHDYPQKAIEAAIDAIHDIDETAAYGNWSWDGTYEARQDTIVREFVKALPVVGKDDLDAEVKCGGKGERCLHNPYKILDYYREYLAPFFRSLEVRVNSKAAA